MAKRTKSPGLDVLLSLNGHVFHQQNGNWSRFEAWEVEPTPAITHGIRYNLTFHDRWNHRIVGFDNSHAIKPLKKKRFSGRLVTWDHKHEREHIEAYEFESPEQLIEKFWETVKLYD